MGWFRRRPDAAQTEDVPVEEVTPVLARPTGVYEGRLACDNERGLYADEGDWAGWSVYHDLERNAYVFVEEGELLHNDIHHAQYVGVTRTLGADENGAYLPGDEHHDGPQPGDDHYVPDGSTKLRFRPNRASSRRCGHTFAYTSGGGA